MKLEMTAEIIDLCGERYSLEEEQERVRQAKLLGLEVIRNDSHHYTVDLDSEGSLAIFRERLAFLQAKGLAEEAIITRSSGGNYHALVTSYTPLTESICIAIQACIGSDWKREILNVLRVLNNQPASCLLFRPQPLEVVEVISKDDYR